MKQTPNSKELFGEIRSCANGATCDLNQLSRWIHEVENDSPGVDAYGYVTYHLGGTPHLWKLLKDQPLDALELLQALETVDEYQWLLEHLPKLELSYTTLWQDSFQSLQLHQRAQDKLLQDLYLRMFEKILPGTLARWDNLDWIHNQATNRERARDVLLPMLDELNQVYYPLNERWRETYLIEDFFMGCPAPSHEDLSAFERCFAAVYVLLGGLWELIIYGSDPFSIFHVVDTLTASQAHLLVAYSLAESVDTLEVARAVIMEQLVVDFIETRRSLLATRTV